ncbi:hypothetical protein AM571_CH00428 [Rhizobium etli 8C-3]|uniref:Uncharacterized protein n=1 Tax=Rhizobium etli 8C-3 TaxID=538025 RepID=A0A1L5NZH1_RHIET|nr:hypothetical protein AM571_CH00428 [Rhizobium etli 8C-3]
MEARRSLLLMPSRAAVASNLPRLPIRWGDGESFAWVLAMPKMGKQRREALLSSGRM